jgi:hypothetical protein
VGIACTYVARNFEILRRCWTDVLGPRVCCTDLDCPQGKRCLPSYEQIPDTTGGHVAAEVLTCQ